METPTGHSLTGAELLIRLLERQGVRTVSGIPGGAVLPIYDALAASGTIRHVLARHEQAAGFIAQGIARTIGAPAVCIASSGPGVTNLLTAIADAKLDSIPLVAITGQVPRGLLGTDAFQEVDTVGLAAPVTKRSFMVRSAEDLARIVPEAFRIAASGRPGPVLIDIPKDVQSEAVRLGALPAPGRTDPYPAPDDNALDRAAALIADSRRPVLYLGGGIIHAGAAGQAAALAEKIAAPVVMTLMALGAMNPDHRLALGMLGMHGARCTNQALHECDLLIAAGARFDDRATGKIEQFCPRAQVVHIDIDAREIGKIKHAHVSIAADAGEALRRLLKRVPTAARRSWAVRVASLKARHPLPWAGRTHLRDPYGLIAAAARAVGTDAIVTTDVGQHQMWVAQAYPLRRPRQLLTSGGLGTMGFGLPAAIGAALAAPERTVVCFSGDGSLLMNLPELATAAEERLDVKIVLMDNGALGLVHQQQAMFYGGRSFAARFGAKPDFIGLAEAFGVPGLDLSSSMNPELALQEALRAPGPCLVRGAIETEERVLPMVPPGAANMEMIEA